MTMEVTLAEKRVIELLRALKANGGHGTLRIEVQDGRETLYKREHSEKAPR